VRSFSPAAPPLSCPPPPHPLPSLNPPRSYGQALAAVSAARSEFERQKVPHRRPDDFFAEMLKSDAHMADVKAKLLAEQGRMQASEGRRAAKESAAFHKQAESEKAKVKAGEKRASMDALKQWRKHKGDARPELSSDKDLEALFKGSGSGTASGGRGAGAGAGAGAGRGGDTGDRFAAGKGGKRKYKDKKYGHGGPKHFSKENDAKSSGNMKGFSVKGMKSRPLAPGMQQRGGAGKKKAAAKGGDRKGKWARSSGKGKGGGGRK
jgi:rRNA-processing protein EBP2